ncbi:MAG: hypothetical protein ABI468_01695 [Candidatus Nanopelagicales bacterium]
MPITVPGGSDSPSHAASAQVTGPLGEPDAAAFEVITHLARPGRPRQWGWMPVALTWSGAGLPAISRAGRPHVMPSAWALEQGSGWW